MSKTIKDRAISLTASKLRLSDSQVRNVVDTYEASRSSVNRDPDGPKSLGGGWYLMPNGDKVQGKKAAGLA